MKQKVSICQFRNGTAGHLDRINTIETEVYVKSHYGPVRQNCSELPMKEQHYHAIEYLGHWWRVEKGVGQVFELCLPCIAILHNLGIDLISNHTELV